MLVYSLLTFVYFGLRLMHSLCAEYRCLDLLKSKLEKARETAK